MATDAAPGRDQENIQGTWRMIGGGEKGKSFDEAEVRSRSLKMKFSGNNWSVKVGDRDGPNATFQLHPETQPKGISFTSADGQVLPGIYRLRGNELTITLAGNPGPRPTKFETEVSTEDHPSPNDRLYILKRCDPTDEDVAVGATDR